MSCPSTSLCVAADERGNVVTSTDPAGGSGAWTVAEIRGAGAISGVSCASASLCVAVDSGGNALVSTDPTGGPTAWISTPVDTGGSLRRITSISCVEGPLCVITDAAGNVVTSTDPTGGASAWTTADIDGSTALNGVSCASTSLCVAVDGAGNVLTSTSPTAGAWPRSDVNGAGPILGVSCTSAPLCVAGASTETGQSPSIVLTSTNPAGGAWTASTGFPAANPGASIGDGISCVTESLCAGIEGGATGGIWQSGEPTAGAVSWANENPDVETILDSISCVTRSLCVAGNDRGEVMTSIEAPPLSVSLQGTGIGGVSATPRRCPFTTCSRPVPPGVIVPQPITGIACENYAGPPSGGGTCLLGYPDGTEVTLTAEPSAASVFDGWGGACHGSAVSCTLIVTGAEPVSASFAPAPTPGPAISALHETASIWREGGALAQTTDHKLSHTNFPIGTTFTFDLNEAASVTFTFTHPTSGRTIGESCVARTKKNKHEHRCTRTIIAGAFTFKARSGPNKVHFDGLISKHKKLKPGSYTLEVAASASGQRPKQARCTSGSPAVRQF